MAMTRDLGSGLEAREHDEAVGCGVAPDALGLDSGHRLGPWNFVQPEDSGARRVADFLRAFDSTGEESKCRRAADAIAGMDASGRPIGDVARGGDSRFVRDGTFDNVQQLVADVTVYRQLHPGFETRQDRAALSLWVGPKLFHRQSEAPQAPLDIGDPNRFGRRVLRSHGLPPALA